MFRITDTPLEELELGRDLADARDGAVVEFQGLVRNHNEGHAVEYLEYEAYEELAVKEARKILDEARDRFQVRSVQCVHRTGSLKIGQMAVWVAAASAHRDAAFQACRYVIDEIKVRLPIWKKETYVDGRAEWVDCRECASHVHHGDRAWSELDESRYYHRQVILPEVGTEGQGRLRNSSVLVVGAGGLGAPVLSYLAAGGVGTIGICDPDTVDLSNLHRQVIHSTTNLGGSKADSAAEHLRKLNPFLNIESFPIRFGADSADHLLEGRDLVLDCTDNFATKFLLHDTCREAGIPLVQAAIYQYEGQLQVFGWTEGESCLRCHWPEVPAEHCVGSCAEVGVLGAVPGVLGSLQAVEALKFLLQRPGSLQDTMVIVDLQDLQIQRINRPKNPDCPLCGAHPAADGPAPPASPEWEIMADAADECSMEWVDIRTHFERVHQPGPRPESPHRPMDEFQASEFPDGRKYLLYCAHGIRSHHLVAELHRRGHTRFYSLRGGIAAVDRN